jgi:two-component system, NarL family, nitrate/nitrite response regulator NarL
LKDSHVSPLLPLTNTALKPIDLVLVDDHSLFRRGLKALLQQDSRLCVIDEAGDVGEALRCVARRRPDLILLDNHLPGVRGIEAIPAFREVAPAVRILLLTVSEEAEDLIAALKAGADGYLLKTMESDHLCDTIVRVIEGESVVSPDMLSKLVSFLRAMPDNLKGEETEAAVDVPKAGLVAEVIRVQTDSKLPKLSAREQEILALIACGDSNKHIARKLDIAETTVKIHVQHILRKLNLTSRVQAAVYAVQQGVCASLQDKQN